MIINYYRRTVLIMLIFGCTFLHSFAQHNDPGLTTGDTGTVTFSYNGNTVTYVTVRAADGQIWLQQNLGSAHAADSINDTLAFGHLFQFGRWDDGHQVPTSITAPTSGLTAKDPSGLGAGSVNFYIGANPNDWWGFTGTTTDEWNDTTISATSGKDPCTAIGPGWSLPSKTDWQAIASQEAITNLATGHSSNLKLVASGNREGKFGNLKDIGKSGSYWSNTPNGLYAKVTAIASSKMNPNDDAYRSYGMSVRCLTNCTGVFPPQSIKGKDTVCMGSTQIYAVPAVHNAAGYDWQFPAGWIVTGPVDNDSINVIVGASAGIIRVKAQNSCGASAEIEMEVHVNPLPQPVIVVTGAELLTGSFVTHTWLFNGQLIPGVTGNSYVATENGNYAVVVTDENGCTDTSEVVTVTLSVGIGKIEAKNKVTIYPNPVNNLLFVESTKSVNLYIYNGLGQLVLVKKSTNILDVSPLPAGIFTLKVMGTAGEYLKTERLIVEKK
jgi:hypothetical protein